MHDNAIEVLELENKNDDIDFCWCLNFQSKNLIDLYTWSLSMFYVQIGKVLHDLKGNVDDFITNVTCGAIGVLFNSNLSFKVF